ncbi:hypothetical protein AB0G02_13905 [Actinosynnema sp. NPDC023658]|uniref:hypothetical protein n=1 Tax=Actinosynnema sp. NPDC023658 TaxID=3155465 RepID=UPI0033E4FF89
MLAVGSVAVTFSTTAVAPAGVREDRSSTMLCPAPTAAPVRVSSTRTGVTGV